MPSTATISASASWCIALSFLSWFSGYRRSCLSLFSSFFFFSSRRRHTRCSRDWSSDVCSSDLLSHASFYFHFISSRLRLQLQTNDFSLWLSGSLGLRTLADSVNQIDIYTNRSEERRVGKECRSRWSPYH